MTPLNVSFDIYINPCSEHQSPLLPDKHALCSMQMLKKKLEELKGRTIQCRRNGTAPGTPQSNSPVKSDRALSYNPVKSNVSTFLATTFISSGQEQISTIFRGVHTSSRRSTENDPIEASRREKKRAARWISAHRLYSEREWQRSYAAGFPSR